MQANLEAFTGLLQSAFACAFVYNGSSLKQFEGPAPALNESVPEAGFLGFGFAGSKLRLPAPTLLLVSQTLFI